jgi:hypothetical protein
MLKILNCKTALNFFIGSEGLKIKAILNILLVLFCHEMYCQFPVSKEYSMVYDSVRSSFIYYEKFEQGKEASLLNNKVIKLPNKLYVISNGLVVEEVEVLKSKDDIEKVFYEFDSLQVLKRKIFCRGDQLYKVEFYESKKIKSQFQYGLNKSSTVFEYYDWGYYKYLDDNNEIKKYEVKVNPMTQKVESNQLKETTPVKTKPTVDIDENGEYYYTVDDKNESEDVFNKYFSYCNCKK